MMTNELKTFLRECAELHAPFKRDNDNKYYQDKYIEIFTYIFDNVPSLDGSVNLYAKDLRIIYRHYKDVLFDLYNDRLIYFNLSRSEIRLLYGNKRWAKQVEKSTGHFSSFYRIDELFVSQILNNSFFYSSRSINVYSKSVPEIIIDEYSYTDKQIYDMKSDTYSNKYSEHQNRKNVTKHTTHSTPNDNEITKQKFTENENYKLLTLNGNPLLEDLPHYGKYTDGRIYSKFHSLDRKTRKQVELGSRGKITEVFDISHCYPTLIGILIGGILDDAEVAQYRTYISNTDIYSDCLKMAGIEITPENRNKIKPYFNKFILSTIKDNKRNLKWESATNDPILFSAVVHFMESKFPSIFNFIWNYKTTVCRVDGKTKRVKSIAHDLQRIEKSIVDKLTALIPADVPFVTLHDAIYIGENDLEAVSDINFEDQFRKVINF